MKCRHCQTDLNLSFVDLGVSPPSNSYVSEDNLLVTEKKFPLRVLVCEQCWLVQTEDFASADSLFTEDYAYFSSFSSSWLKHCENYVNQITKRLNLTPSSLVVEIAANDGYLLKNFIDKKIPCLGIEPTTATADSAREKGIEVVEDFFGVALAEELYRDGKQADLLIANNVLAHVPDINDFVAGFTTLLKQDGVATFEFPHLCNLVELNQFDTIYHEHFSYLSLSSVNTIFKKNGLEIFDVEQLNTHGGSLRVYAQRSQYKSKQVEAAVSKLLVLEQDLGVLSPTYYSNFDQSAQRVRDDFLQFLRLAKEENKKVTAYGAAAKGNTLLNFSGVDNSSIAYVVDKNPNKQGLYLPGSKIPIVDESVLVEDQPDYIIIFPWNLKREIMAQLNYAKDWGAEFIVAVPKLTSI